MSKDKMKMYSVWAKCKQYVTVDICALNLDDAFQKAIDMKEEEFVQVIGEYYDGEFNITGVTERGK